MTTPAAPTTPAPAAPSPAPTSADPTPAAPPAGDQQQATPPATPTAPAAPANPWDDPATAKTEIERLRRENAKDRTAARNAAADDARRDLAAQIGKALGLVKDDSPVDPAALTQQVEQANATALASRVENAVMRAALTVGGNPLALLDSVSFLGRVAAIDPADGAAYEAAVKDAVTSNPAYGLAPQPRVPAPNPAQGTSGAGPTPSLTLDQQVADAEKARDFKRADRLRAQQLLEVRKAQA